MIKKLLTFITVFSNWQSNVHVININISYCIFMNAEFDICSVIL